MAKHSDLRVLRYTFVTSRKRTIVKNVLEFKDDKGATVDCPLSAALASVLVDTIGVPVVDKSSHG